MWFYVWWSDGTWQFCYFIPAESLLSKYVFSTQSYSIYVGDKRMTFRGDCILLSEKEWPHSFNANISWVAMWRWILFRIDTFLVFVWSFPPCSRHRNVSFSIIVCWLFPRVQSVFRCGTPAVKIHIFSFSSFLSNISLEVLFKHMSTWSTWINTNHKGLCWFLSSLNDNFARKTFSGCLFFPLRSINKWLIIKVCLYVLIFWLDRHWKFSSNFNVIQKKKRMRNINEHWAVSTQFNFFFTSELCSTSILFVFSIWRTMRLLFLAVILATRLNEKINGKVNIRTWYFSC